MNEKQDLVCVFKGQAFEAEVVRARLESDGIPAMVMNNTISAIFSTYTAMAGTFSGQSPGQGTCRTITQGTMKQPQRIAVKVGSNVLTRPDGRLDISRMAALVDQIAELRRRGIEVLLISSGAVASGRGALPHLQDESVTGRQLFAAVGQAKLIEHYYDLFQEYGITVGQILTTKENFTNETLHANQMRCMTAMLDNGVVPVINENDTVSVEELMFTDNDELSGLVARMMKAEILIILSNVDGVFTGNPDDPSSELIHDVYPDDDYSGCVGKSKSKFGRGGMMTKMKTALGVASDGIEVRIANGRRQDVLLDVLSDPDNARCTRFHAKKK